MKLMKQQIEDSSRMATEGDLPNYSKAGTGKTLTTLEAFRKSGHDRALILGPVISLKMWKEEFETWVGGKAQIIRPGNATVDKEADAVIISYDMAAGSMRSYLYQRFSTLNKGKSTGALILDEAHYLRTHTTKRNIAVFGQRTNGAGGLMEVFDQVWSLTGNPIYRHADDLWGQLVALFPEVFEHYKISQYKDFVNAFCVSQLKKYNKRMAPKQVIIASQNEPVLNHIIYNVIKAIRRLDAPELPELVTRYSYPKLGLVPASYAALVDKLTEEQIVKSLVSPDADDELQKGWQVVSLAKVPDVASYVADSALNSPVLVGVWHNAVGEAYYQELQERHGLKVARVYGATPANVREQIRDDFNAGNLDVIVGQMAAMGVSWNLQKAASHVVVAQDHYSPAVIEQFYKRVYRTGQQSKVLLDIMTSDHPIDKAIKRIRERKEVSHDKILGS